MAHNQSNRLTEQNSQWQINIHKHTHTLHTYILYLLLSVILNEKRPPCEQHIDLCLYTTTIQYTTHSKKNHLSGGVPASWPGVQDGRQHVFVDGVGTNGSSSKHRLQTFQNPSQHRWLFDSFFCRAYRCATKQQPQKSIHASFNNIHGS
jgi:hypothetical protein